MTLYQPTCDFNGSGSISIFARLTSLFPMLGPGAFKAFLHDVLSWQVSFLIFFGLRAKKENNAEQRLSNQSIKP